jgi:DNA repair exonuclease SbcCD nuclease subunit
MIRVLLTSDLHLGSGRRFLIREADRLLTLKKIVSLAKDHDLLLIAGDLFDRVDPDETIIREVAQLFSILQNKGIRIVFAPGKNETAKGKPAGFMHALGAHRIFGDDNTEPFVMEIGAQKLYIYGTSPALPEGNVGVKKTSDDGFHVGLFYTKIDDIDEADPPNEHLTIEDLKSRKLDFYALGHSHSFKLYKYLDMIVGAYPGSPEASDATETGDRYVLSLTINNNELTQIKRLTVNTVNVVRHEIDCEEHTLDTFIETIRKLKGDNVCAFVTITGRRPFLLPNDRIRECTLEFYRLSITDESTISIYTLAQHYADEQTLRGDFFRALIKSLDENTIPSDIDLNKLSDILSSITGDRKIPTEDWLCDLLHA